MASKQARRNRIKIQGTGIIDFVVRAIHSSAGQNQINSASVDDACINYFSPSSFATSSIHAENDTVVVAAAVVLIVVVSLC